MTRAPIRSAFDFSAPTKIDQPASRIDRERSPSATISRTSSFSTQIVPYFSRSLTASFRPSSKRCRLIRMCSLRMNRTARRRCLDPFTLLLSRRCRRRSSLSSRVPTRIRFALIVRRHEEMGKSQVDPNSRAPRPCRRRIRKLAREDDIPSPQFSFERELFDRPLDGPMEIYAYLTYVLDAEPIGDQPRPCG